MIRIPGWKAVALVAALYLLECAFTQDVEVPVGQRRGKKIRKIPNSHLKVGDENIFFVISTLCIFAI